MLFRDVFLAADIVQQMEEYWVVRCILLKMGVACKLTKRQKQLPRAAANRLQLVTLEIKEGLVGTVLVSPREQWPNVMAVNFFFRWARSSQLDKGGQQVEH